MNEHGPEVCKWFFNGTQRVINNWLIFNGFSIGIGDTIADEKTMTNINEIIKFAKDQVKKIINKAQDNLLESQPGMTIRESFEAGKRRFKIPLHIIILLLFIAVLKELNRCRDAAGKAAQTSLKEQNNVKQMVKHIFNFISLFII